jgi:hypothetical protein
MAAWVKGQSGNPGGRPKELKEITRLARDLSPEAILRLAFWMRSDNAKASVAASNAILDRGYGKPTQSFSMSDDTGKRPEEMTDAELVSIARGGSDRAAEEASGETKSSGVH